MIPAGTRVYFAKEPVDLRRSFDGLAATALSQLGMDAREGGMFVFLNRRGNQVRVLFRDAHGWCLLSKRLDSGTFKRPEIADGKVYWETDAPRLLRFIDDIMPSKRSTRQASGPHRKLKLVQH